MKANELRIGNYVKLDGVDKPFKVFVIDTTETSTITKCKPIELTEEWFLKFGFSQGVYEWSKDREYFEWFSDGYYFTDGEGYKIGMLLKYVHQLQNLYFALTGEELKLIES